MDPATLIGVLAGLVIIVVANVMEGGDPTSLLLVPPMLLVFGTTLMVTMAGGTIADAKHAMLSVKTAFTAKVRPAGDVVPMVVALAEKARREGLLALEDDARDRRRPVPRQGPQLADRRHRPGGAARHPRRRGRAKKDAGKSGAKFFDDAGGYAPTIGIIGTVMGLVHVLENLDEPESSATCIAAAFVATLWGVLSANMIWLPIGSRLKGVANARGRADGARHRRRRSPSRPGPTPAWCAQKLS